jgi:putative ABC transport system substrate-binding protein
LGVIEAERETICATGADSVTIRLLLFWFGLHLLVAVTPLQAQETGKVPTIGILMLTAGPDDPIINALREGLRELGYVEGQNIRFELRTAGGRADRLPMLAKQLVQLRSNVILVTNTIAAQAVQRTSSAIPIVVALIDPLASGLVTNLAHPDGQVTGLSSLTTELYAKRLELLKEVIPSLTRVAVLWNPELMPAQIKVKEVLETIAPTLSIDLTFVSVRTATQLGAAFSAIGQARGQAVFLVDNALFYANRAALAKLAVRARLPAIYGARAFADDGGLMSYGANYGDQMRRAAVYVDKIFKGAKPGDLPIEQSTKFELVINLKTAKALGIAIPESILARADETIR